MKSYNLTFSQLHCPGKRLQLDFHFCQAESNLSHWRGLLGAAHFRVEHTAVLLEMVYFMWFVMGQPHRAACMLTKVIVKPVHHSLAWLCCFYAWSFSCITIHVATGLTC